jgi:hypothetical protein
MLISEGLPVFQPQVNPVTVGAWAPFACTKGPVGDFVPDTVQRIVLG